MALPVQLQIHRSVRFGRYLEFAALTLVARAARQGMPRGQARETGVKRTRQEDTQEEDSNGNMKTLKQKKQIDNTETQKLRQTAHRDNTTTTDNTTHRQTTHRGNGQQTRKTRQQKADKTDTTDEIDNTTDEIDSTTDEIDNRTVGKAEEAEVRQQRVVREERDSKAEVRQQVRKQGAVSKRVNIVIKPKPKRNKK